MSMQVTVTPPDSAAIVGPAQKALDLMKSLDIDSPELAEYVGGEVQKCSSMHRKLDDQRKAIVKPLDEARQKIQELFRPALEILEQAKRIGGQKIVEYQRRVDEDRRRKQAEADAAARRERERLAREAAEAKAKAEAEAEELRKKAEAAAAAGRMAEAGRLEAKANAKEEAGEAKAMDMQAEAAAIPTTVLVPEAPKIAGISSRENWDFEIINPDAIPREYLIPDEKAIRSVVKALKGKTNIAGIRVFDKGTVAVRA